MNFKLRIKAKMMLYILSASLLIYIIAIGYISYTARQMAYKNVTEKVNAIAEKHAFQTQSKLNVEMDVTRTLSQTFKGFVKMPDKKRNQLSHEILQNVLQEYPDFLSIWLHWELSAINENYDLPYGRIRNTFYRIHDEIKFRTDSMNLEGDIEGSLYHRIKLSKKEVVSEPYYYSYTQKKEDEVLETSVCVPVIVDNKFVGLMGTDLDLDRFQKVISEIKPFPESSAFLLAHNGTFVANQFEDFVGANLFDIIEDESNKKLLMDGFEEAKPFSYSYVLNGNKEFVSYSPLKIGKTETPWFIGIVVPEKVMLQQAYKSFYISLLVGVIGLILISIVIWFISGKISAPLTVTTDVLKKLSKGEIDVKNKMHLEREDEIGEMAESVNTLIEGLNSTASFATQIGEGNLDAEFSLLSEKDVLGNALIEMRQSLTNAKEEEKKRKIEDEKESWATQGLAIFGDILRQNNDNIKLLSFDIMSNLVKYIDSVQGAIFVRTEDDDEIIYELQAAIAFERNRLVEKKIKEGDGLVGRCAHEKLTIHMSEVPDDYARITSGLGDTNPSNILLVPLKLNDEIHGVIELASFNKFEKHQIAFIETLGQNIATTLSSVKINEKTVKLLEESQKQQEELSSQEEEMRQNLEEMHATQEEAARRQSEMEALWEALNQSNLVVEFDKNGKILNVNEKNVELVGIPADEMVGKYHKDFAKEAIDDPDGYKDFWENLLAGKPQTRVLHADIKGESVIIKETYTPIKNEEGEIEKILNIGTDITDLLKQNEEIH
jgi:PAS domain S-box-containing protein